MVDTLLDIVSKVLPADDSEWEMVATEFNTRCNPRTPREGKDVKCKFDSLQKPLRTGSGGDPCHQKANELETLIREKAGSMVYSTGVSVDYLDHQLVEMIMVIIYRLGVCSEPPLFQLLKFVKPCTTLLSTSK